MRAPAKFSIALVTLFAACFPVFAGFTAPTSVAPYLPSKNTANVAAVTSNVPGVDQYAVAPTDTPPSPGFTLSVTAGTPLSAVQDLATGNIAYRKFIADTVSAGDQYNPFVLQVAAIWFMNNIGRPYYGL